MEKKKNKVQLNKDRNKILHLLWDSHIADISHRPGSNSGSGDKQRPQTEGEAPALHTGMQHTHRGIPLSCTEPWKILLACKMYSTEKRA